MSFTPSITNLLVVMPVMREEMTDVCIESIFMPNSAAGIKPEQILLVDNAKQAFAHKYGLRVYRDPEHHNLGVARAWNIGAREVLENKNLEYLVIMSASMRFGPELHTTWVKQMQTFWGANCIEADGHSWHLIAFHRRVFELIGLFDENFYPGYFEAIDFGYRMRMLNIEGGWPRVWVNALSQGVAMHAPLISCPAEPLLAYYHEKWGGDKGEETHVLPYGDKPLGYFEHHSIPELAAKYRLKEWW